MDIAVAVGWSAGLLVLCTLAWALNLVSLPGNWIAVGLVGLYAWLGPEAGRASITWPVVAAVFAVAVLGEVIEFFAAAFGAQRAGASRRSTMFAVLGSLGGAVMGMVFGSAIPIPIVGSVVAAVLFGSVGATLGAMYGEWSGGKTWGESWSVGHAAFWGRLFGTVGKLASGVIILVVIAAAVLL
ncbi:DUF456 domain-containing protein [Candidatus Laterigemmans baculatus]|uniref:DUF456 domain-containing protein n=1 Tax=Candidatus Laterigemmans baculatus TaxID=2770505 RepID=UPI001F39BD6B|nr:DUF456 domain-containing protein [Candidatus Laterigemmans baculatus]